MKQIGVPYTLQAIQLAPEFIWHSFEQSEHNRRNVELVSVIVKITGGFAGLTENNNSTIFLNSDYIEKINGNVRKEFTWSCTMKPRMFSSAMGMVRLQWASLKALQIILG